MWWAIRTLPAMTLLAIPSESHSRPIGYGLGNSPMARTLNFILYQTGWFACVLGAALSRPWLGSAIALTLVGIHLYLTTERIIQWKIVTVAFCVGLLTDSLLLHLGVYRFTAGVIVDWLPPLWMSVLWVQFATTFRYCLHWLSRRYIASAVLALVGAPMAFLGGEKIGAISILEPRVEHLLILGVIWSISIPLLVYASDSLSENRAGEDRLGGDCLPGYRGITTPPKTT